MLKKVPVLEAKKQENNRKPKNMWKPGKSGNPKGRPPKDYSITEAIRAVMDEKPEVKRALAEKIVEMALGGDFNAIKTIWAYMDGQPRQPLDLMQTDNEQFDKLREIVSELQDNIKTRLKKEKSIASLS